MKLLSLFVVTLCVVSLVLATGNNKTFTRVNAPTSSSVVVTYAASQVDTLVYGRELGLNTLALSAQFNDSVSVTRIVVRRVINGVLQAVLAGDTLTAFNSFANVPNSANPTSAVTAQVTIDPLCDVYWFIVTYASSNQGTDNNTVSYILQKRYNVKQ